MANAQENAGPQASGAVASSVSERLVSLDALRGFDMFWIVGAGALVKGLKEVSQGSVIWQTVAEQLEHVKWVGFRFYDLIFPLFVFIAGASLVFSLTRIIEREGRGAALRRIFRRFVLLFLLGIFYYGGFSNEWPGIRVVGVLQRIALCYLAAGVLFCFLKQRGLAIVCVALLAGYWALFTFVPPPGMEAPSFAEEANWASWVDQHYLPGLILYGGYDPEGLLSTLPAVATCLLGVFAGMLLKTDRMKSTHRIILFLAGGALLASFGYLWGLQFPVIKKIWTSSYVLVAGGYSFILLGVFYTVVDVWQFRKWATPFVWMGSNALTIYLACNLIHFEDIARRLVGGDIERKLGIYGQGLVAVMSLVLVFAFVGFLYKKRLFLRL